MLDSIQPTTIPADAVSYVQMILHSSVNNTGPLGTASEMGT